MKQKITLKESNRLRKKLLKEIEKAHVVMDNASDRISYLTMIYENCSDIEYIEELENSIKNNKVGDYSDPMDYPKSIKFLQKELEKTIVKVGAQLSKEKF